MQDTIKKTMRKIGVDMMCDDDFPITLSKRYQSPGISADNDGGEPVLVAQVGTYLADQRAARVAHFMAVTELTCATPLAAVERAFKAANQTEE